MKKIVFIFGTRPEAIKMAPVIIQFQESGLYQITIISTGQHREMLKQVIDTFKLKIGFDLNLMKNNQDITELTGNILIALKKVLSKVKPDLVFVQGDTTTTMAGSLAAFYKKIPVAHIEAGLRTWNNYFPFPEEVNREISSVIATYHFAPTELAKNNLLKSGYDSNNIFVTGNTVIDSLFYVSNNFESFNNLQPVKKMIEEYKNKKIILVTGHRRENLGKGLINICDALKEIALNNINVQIIFPVHLNPNVQRSVNSILSGIDNISLIKPLEYEPFIYLMSKAYIILTDSGGIQEEAPSLGKPVLVLRNETERPEAVEAGTVILVGTNKNQIINRTEELLKNLNTYNKFANRTNPFGDGNSSKIIFDKISKLIKHNK